MIKVLFCCSWDSNFENFLNKKYKPLTPNNSGIWKNIEATTNIDKAEWVIVIDDIHPSFRNRIKLFDKNKVICIPREPGRSNPNYNVYNMDYYVLVL